MLRPAGAPVATVSSFLDPARARLLRMVVIVGATSTHRVTNVVLAVVLLAGFAIVFLPRSSPARGGFTIRDWRVWLGLLLFVALIVILGMTV